MIKRLTLLISLISILFITNSFHVSAFDENSSFNYLYFYIDNNSNTNKISYEIKPSDYLLKDDVFSLKTYYNNKLISDNCEKKLDITKDIIFKKITCDVLKRGNGEYKFIAIISRNNTIIKKITNIEHISTKTVYSLQNKSGTIEFEDLGNKTLITLNINTTGKNLLILNQIPKSVIKYLDNSNKGKLIQTNYKYKIIKKDPLIAWTVDKTPAKINYTLNKHINITQQKKFKIEISPQSTSLRYLKYVIIILIIVIIVIAFRPAFKKK